MWALRGWPLILVLCALQLVGCAQLETTPKPDPSLVPPQGPLAGPNDLGTLATFCSEYQPEILVVSAKWSELWPFLDQLGDIEGQGLRDGYKALLVGDWNGRILYGTSTPIVTNRGHHWKVIATNTGRGKANTAMTVQMVVDICPIKAVIRTGIAGAINPIISVGDVVVPYKEVAPEI